MDPDNRLANYTVTNPNGALTITKADLTVVNTNRSKVYGVVLTNADYAGSITGIQAGDTITITRASTGGVATATVAGSTYPIVGTLVDPDNRLANYTVTNPNGALTITKADLTVVNTNRSKVYGVVLTNADYAGSITGIQAGDDITITRASTGGVATATVAGSTYPIVGTLVDPDNRLANYTVTNPNGALTITKADLTVVNTNRSKVYGVVLTNADYAGSITGIQAGDDITITRASTGGVATATVAGSTYPIVGTLVDPDNRLANYTVTNPNGALTITKADLTVVNTNRSKVYGVVLTNADYAGSITGIQAGDTITIIRASTGGVANATVVAPGPTYPIIGTLTDPNGRLVNYTVTNPNGVLTITPAPVTSSVSVSPTTVQYSDQATFTAIIVGGKPLVTGGPQAAVSATFRVGTQTMGTANFTVIGSDLVATGTYALVESVVGQMAPGVRTVTAVINGADSNFGISNLAPTNNTLNIDKEDARVEYTGDIMKATASSSTRLATVQLRANIFDISVPGDPAYDAFPGDIRNAKVMFVDRDNSNAPISGWIPVSTLLNPTDTKVGTVSYNHSVNLPTSADYIFLNVGVIVDSGYYIRNNPEDNTVVTVYLPVGDFITGGGYIVPTQSIGTMASTPGKKVNFGFNVKFNKTGKNLNGNMNIIFRRLESDGIVHSYQIKANAMISLGVNASNPSSQIAEYVSKTNLTDITNPLSTISMGGNKYLYVKMTDNGEPGVNDMISFVLVEGTADPTVPANIIFSSNWVSFKTQQMKLGGGNLKVQSGFNLGTTASPTTKIVSAIVEKTEDVKELSLFNVIAYPNPSTSYFAVAVNGGSNEKVTVKVYDVLGRLLNNIQSTDGQNITFGSDLPRGTYITVISQGTESKTIKLIKN